VLDPVLRERILPNSTLKGAANLFVCPNLDAANVAYNVWRMVSEGVAIGPILLGIDGPAHVLTTAATVRRVVNQTAIAAVDAKRVRKARSQA
jgi:malate dehydrogenase (oxaloacetate-decarboxylating)(NADP+)